MRCGMGNEQQLPGQSLLLDAGTSHQWRHRPRQKGRDRVNRKKNTAFEVEFTENTDLQKNYKELPPVFSNDFADTTDRPVTAR